MEKHEFRKNAADMIYLIACVVNGKTPKAQRVENMNIDQLFEVCQKHILTACVAYALESVGIKNHEFNQAKEKAIRKNILLDAERSRILRRLESENIWYMPLKGALLKDWYPKLGMRQMSDNDILIDGAGREKTKSIMKELGFKLKASRYNVDEFCKEPVYNFEMHESFFPDQNDDRINRFSKYYKDISPRLIKDKNNEYGYHFSIEDFYLYMIAHEYKHFSGGGTGVRSLLDIYVFMQKFDSSLDWSYLNEELRILGIEDFERESRELSMKIFRLKKLTADDKRLLNYYVMSGTYGTIQNSVNNKLNRKGSKFLYILDRVFPSMSFIKTGYPFFYRHKFLIPILIIIRPVRGLIINRKRIINELKVIVKK